MLSNHFEILCLHQRVQDPRFYAKKTINNALKNISSDADFDAAYDYWYEGKFEEAEGRIQFVKIITDDRLDIDEELLCDIKKIFKERFDKKVDREKVRDVKRVERQKEEAASDKQVKYARKVYGEEKGFDDREYSKFEMIGIIGELKEKSYKGGSRDSCKNQ